MDNAKRQHPLQMFPFIGKYLFLLSLPLLRGLIAVRDPAGLQAWVRGSWFDILIVLLILMFAYFSWRCSRICVQSGILTVQNGWLIRREAAVPLKSITTLTVEAPFYLRPFFARRVFIDTAGGIWRNPDFQLLLYKKDAAALLSLRVPQQPPPPRRCYRARWRYLLFLSFCVSNSFTGAVLAAAFFKYAGEILGAEFQQLLLSGLDTLAAPLRFLPYGTAIIALLLLIGWAVHFLRNLLHYIGFSVKRYKDLLHIRSGFFTLRTYTCPIRAINFLDFRQTVFSKILGLYVVFIHCIGYGKRKRDKAVLLPAATASTTARVTEQLLWELPHENVTVRPVKYALWRYVRWPLIALGGVPLTVYALTPRYAFFTALLHFVGVMLCVPILWRLIVAVLETGSAGIGITTECLTLCYARRFTLHTVVIPRDRISFIRLRQSVFQKRRDICDVLVYTHNERRTCHRVRQLPRKDIQKLFDI